MERNSATCLRIVGTPSQACDGATYTEHQALLGNLRILDELSVGRGQTPRKEVRRGETDPAPPAPARRARNQWQKGHLWVLRKNRAHVLVKVVNKEPLELLVHKVDDRGRVRPVGELGGKHIFARLASETLSFNRGGHPLPD